MGVPRQLAERDARLHLRARRSKRAHRRPLFAAGHGVTAANLDAQYDTSLPIGGDVAPYFERFAAASEAARREHAFETLLYGEGERETLDLFRGTRDDAPILVWIHGGYWRRMSKDAFSFVAPPVVARGGTVAIVSYPLAPAATLEAIVAAVRRAFASAARACAVAGEPPRRFVVGGHSVGAQLAAMIAATAPVDGLFALSGLYDLMPLLKTTINDTIAMDSATARRYSPIDVPPQRIAPLVIACGEREQSEFHRQQRDYVDAWRRWGGSVREVPAPRHDHFSIVLELADRGAPLCLALADLLFGGA